MSLSALDIGITGLQAAQAGMAVTSHNVANVSTPGYHRQETVQGTLLPQQTGSGFFGSGVQVETVKRNYSAFLDNAVSQAQTQSSYFSTLNAQLTQIDNLLADPSAGVSPSLQAFFSAVQDVATNPASVPSRQQMISTGQALVAQFQSLDSQLAQMRAGINSQISDSVGQINALAQQIAQVNKQIALLQINPNQPPNDLLDQRGALISQLNQLVRTSEVSQSDGTVNVFIGNGQSLVIGGQSFSLSAAASSADPQDFGVYYQIGSTSAPLNPSTLQGGSLGAVLAFRSQNLTDAQNQLGRVAIVLAQTFNDQHELGQDLNGNLGTAFFQVPAAGVIGNANNTGSAVISATNTNVGALTASDYQLTFNAGTWTLTRLSDNTQTTFATFPQTVDGVTLDLTSGAAANGDSFLIEPTRDGAQNVSVLLTDPSLVAAAAPIAASASLSNTGTATINPGSVNPPPPPDPNLLAPVTITFTGANTFNVTGTGTGNPTGVAYTSGADITYNGWTTQISGTPAAGDTFTIGPNTGGTADNRNALLLASLQTANTVANGTASYQSAYSQLVSSIGDATNAAQVQSQAQSAILQQTTQAQQSLSGVNLDEEAANLIHYQQAYQASAQVIATSSQLFQSLITALNAA